jgi:hypothetical protein
MTVTGQGSLLHPFGASLEKQPRNAVSSIGSAEWHSSRSSLLRLESFINELLTAGNQIIGLAILFKGRRIGTDLV